MTQECAHVAVMRRTGAITRRRIGSMTCHPRPSTKFQARCESNLKLSVIRKVSEKKISGGGGGGPLVQRTSGMNGRERGPGQHFVYFEYLRMILPSAFVS